MDRIYQLRRKFGLDKVQLTYRSLVRMSVSIIGIFIILAWIASIFTSAKSSSRFSMLAGDDYFEAEKQLYEHLTKNPDSKEHWRLLVDLRALYKARMPAEISPEENSFESYETGFNSKPFFEAQSFMDFLETAIEPSPEALKVRYLFRVSGGKNSEILFNSYPKPEIKYELALASLGTVPYSKTLETLDNLINSGYDNEEIRKLAIRCLTILKDNEEISRRLVDPKWQKYADNHLLYSYHFAERNYPQMIYYLTLSQYDHYTWQVIVVCLVAGFGWAFFLIHLGAGWSWPKRDFALIIAAIILGMMSAILTLFVVELQHDWIDYDKQEKTVIYNLAYCILGIGLREELCKMLLFIPLLWFLKNERSPCKILIFSSLVGLGFAIEENFGYITRADGHPAALMARFMTANFLHMLMTGYICYHLTIAFQKKGRYWDDFTNAFIKMTIIHGVYDFFLIDETMVSQGMEFFAMMLYIWIAMQYMRLMLYTSPPSHRYVSLTRVFTIVLSVSFGLCLFIFSLEIGVILAVKASIMAIISNVIFAYMFYHVFNEVVR